MALLRKALRIVVLVILIALATIGIGLSGAIPVFGSTKKDEFIEVNTEQIDSVDEESSEDKTLEIRP